MNFEIREMVSEDADKVLEIYNEGINNKSATFETSAPKWEDWDTSHLSFCRWVLEDEQGNTIGWAALKPYSKRDCYRGVAEVSIYIDEKFQAKGLGTMLLKKLILDSEEQKIWTLQASTFPENKSSIAIHQKLGFRLVGHRERIAQLDGVWKDVVLLERRSKLI